MSDDILSHYGSDTSQPQAATSSNGGRQTPKDIPYSPPVGPKGQSHTGPGLGGTNHGNAPGQGRH